MKRAIWILAALLTIYVGAYLSLVVPVPSGIDSSFGFNADCDAIPSYRLGGLFFEQIFDYAQRIDTRIRPEYWHFTEVEMNAGRPDGQDPLD